MHRLTVPCLFLLLAMPAMEAQTVSVLAFQEGLAADGETEQYLTDLASGVMDGLFFSGMIATSQRPAPAPTGDIQERLGDICGQALLDRVSFLIIMRVEDGEFLVEGRKIRQPRTVRYLCVDCDGASVVLEAQMPGPEDVLPAEALKTWCLKAGEGIQEKCVAALRGREEGNP